MLQAGYEEWLMVAWGLGLEEEYRKVAREVCLRCGSDEFGNLVNEKGFVVRGVFPEGCLGEYCSASLLSYVEVLMNARSHQRGAARDDQRAAHIRVPARQQRHAREPMYRTPLFASAVFLAPSSFFSLHGGDRTLTMHCYKLPQHAACAHSTELLAANLASQSRARIGTGGGRGAEQH